MSSRPDTKKKAVKKLYQTPRRTREELEFFLNPPEDVELTADQKKVLNRHSNRNQIDWGLLGMEYPVHALYYYYMKQSSSTRKNPLPTEYEFTGKSFMEFVLEVGLPKQLYTNPVIQLKEENKGFVSGNFYWADKTEQDKKRFKNTMKNRKKFLENRRCITFMGRNYYETKVSGVTEFIWDSKRVGEKTAPGADGKSKSTLRYDVWCSVYEPPTGKRIITYIDPEGDLTDPNNLKLKYDSPESESNARLADFRQASADIIWGYLKICIGCGGTWRVIEDKVIIVREGTKNLFGPCEESHKKISKKRKWENQLEIVKAGLTIPHAPIPDPDANYRCGYRSDTED